VNENPLQASSNRVALSIEAFLIFSVISILAVPLALAPGLTPKIFLTSLLMGLVITGLLGITFRLALLFFSTVDLSRLKIHPEGFSIGVILALGALRGLLLFYAIAIVGYAEPSSIWLRMATSTATTFLWFTVIAAIVSDRNNFRKGYESLVRNSILTIAGQKYVPNQVNVPSHVVNEISEIESLLMAIFGDIPSHPPTSDSLYLAAAKVRQIIDSKIRPLSQMLWMESASTPPKVSYRQVGIQSLKNLSITPLYGALLVSIISVINISTTLGLKRGLFGTVTIFVTLFICYRVQSHMKERVKKSSININALILLVPGLILSFIFYLSNKYLFFDDIGPLNFVYVGICAISGLLISAFEQTKADRANLLKELEVNLKNAEGQSSLIDRTSPEKIASFLHNSLQSELLALAAQIELLANDPQSDSARGFIERLDSRVHKSIRDDLEGFLNEPLMRLSKIQSAWKGIANINLDIPDAAMDDPKRNFLLVQVIEESITNAIRHGRSKNISVKGTLLADGDLRIEIINDGINSKSSSQGIGSQWLDRFSKAGWSRTSVGEQTILSITL